MIGDTLLDFVRRHDPDRFFTALFAPPARRGLLLVLYAFNHELARAREVASEPPLALIRLQWWREVVEGAPRSHEVATPLRAALEAGGLQAADLLEMIAGREAEAEPAIPDREAFLAYLRATGGALARAAGRALGGQGAVLDRLRELGAAYALAGQLRNFVPLARHGRCLLPEDLLAERGMSVYDAMARPTDPAILQALRELAALGKRMLGEAGGPIPRHVLAAALPAALARRDLRRAGALPAPRGLGDRLAVLRAVLLSRP